jgi:predicted RND superfamily exporter protein
MWLVPDVIRVSSLINFSWVHAVEDDIEVEPLIPDDEPLTQAILDERKAVALAHETVPGYLVSPDGKTALVYARLRPGFESPPDARTIVLATKELIADVEGGDHSFHLSGTPALNHSFRDAAQTDLSNLIPFVLLVAFLFQIVLLRTIGGLFLPVIVIVTSVAAAIGLAGWFDFELTTVTMILPQILIAVAIADSIHILSSFYRARRSGVDKLAAARHSLTKNFLPTILTSLSTAAGFFAFSTSSLKPIFSLGILAGCGAIIAWFVTYLIVGPLLCWLPSWIRVTGKVTDLTRPTERALAFTHWLQRNRWHIIGAYAAICIGAVWLATNNRVNADPYKYFAEDYPLRQGQDFIIDNLDGVAAFEMSVDSGVEDGIKDPAFLAKVEEFERQVVALPGISKSVSLVETLKQTHRALGGDKPEEYKLPHSRELVAQELLLYTMSLPQGMDLNDQVTVKNDAIRLTLISNITDSATWTQTADTIEGVAGNLGLDITISGKVMLFQSMNGYVVRSFVESLLIAVLVVSLLIIIAFRSFRQGAIAMLPNIVPLIIGGAVLKLLDHSLDIGTVLVCSVCLGIAVDDTIHILTNYRHHRQDGADATEALAMTLTHTAPALVVTTLVLVAAFGTLAFGTLVPNVYFGIMTAVILMAALVTDFTFLPAILLARDGVPATERPTITVVEPLRPSWVIDPVPTTGFIPFAAMPDMTQAPISYGQDVETIFDFVTDIDEIKRHCKSIGANDVQIDIGVDGDLTTITATREIDTDLPGLSTRQFQQVSTIVERREWLDEGPRKTCKLHVSVLGAPAAAVSTITISPSDAGCVYEVKTEASGDVPVLRKTLENLDSAVVAGVHRPGVRQRSKTRKRQ